MKVQKFTRWVLFSALAIIALMALAACGGDDDDDSSDGGLGASSGSGSDADYVAVLCKATKAFGDDMSKITADPSKLKDPSDIGKLFAEPFDTYAKAVAKAKPPSDLKDYHKDMVKVLNDAAAKIKTSKDLSELSSLGDGTIPEPPQAVKDRLQKVAEKNKDCVDADVDFQ